MLLTVGPVVDVRRVLAQENWRLVAAGGRADDLAEEATRVAEAAFDQLCQGVPRLA
ncbi:hypothetical protein [Streptomyces albidoflavus]|uniref:hypothetical protein n=1 Tax=Streptomyces albidoflavus TaxID=1886 RepID=UPI00211C48F2